MAEQDAAAVFPLHYSVFQGDIKKVAALCRSEDINKKDPHGNTALHLAIMMGRKGKLSF
jgi:ankyrin repeat protein